jgi:hypothetical protein
MEVTSKETALVGAVRPVRTGLGLPPDAGCCAEHNVRYSKRAAVRLGFE